MEGVYDFFKWFFNNDYFMLALGIGILFDIIFTIIIVKRQYEEY